MSTDIITVKGIHSFEDADGEDALYIGVADEDVATMRNLKLDKRYRLVPVEED